MELQDIKSNKESDIVNQVLPHLLSYSEGEVIVTDENLNIIFKNSKFDFKNNKFSLENLIPNNILQKLKNSFEEFKQTCKEHICFKIIVQNIPLEFHICKIIKENCLKGFTIIFKDITSELKREIQKETFVDILLHDFKNPIRSNIQVLELILDGKMGNINSEVKDILQELLSSSYYLKYMTENLVYRYKNEFNSFELQKEEQSILAIIREKSNKILKFLKRRNQTIELIINGEIPLVSLDVEQIGRVVNNLLVNASEQSVENAKIIVQIEQIRDGVKVDFIDYGYNKTDENLKEMFDEYITCANKFRKVGQSLDLYNCKKIVEAHDGYIKAERSDKKGTKISFVLPIC